jgi:beta-lactamase regulating signal transducer with metallopeptidase domain
MWLNILDDHLRMIWWGGITAFALWRIIRMFAGFWWLRKSAFPVGANLQQMGRSISSLAGLGEPLRLAACRELTTPLLIGWVKPSVFLPEESSAWDSQKIEAVLLHELAHWQRRDGWWQALAAVTSSVWWWNPLVWLAVGQLKMEAEQAADDMVVLRQHNAPYYAQALVEIAAAAAKQNFPMGVAMVGRSSLETRIRAILYDNPWRGKLGKLGTGMAVSLACMLLVLGSLYLRAESPSAHTRATNTVDINGTVTDKAGDPIQGATVRILRAFAYSGFPELIPLDFPKIGTSDGHGFFSIKNVTPGVDFTLVVTASSYAPDIGTHLVQPAFGPAQFTLLAAKSSDTGAMVRGHVVDPQGKPVVGAGVFPYLSYEGVTTHSTGGVGPTPWQEYQATTDENGFFSLPLKPGCQAIGVEIFASGFSRKKFAHIPLDNELHDLKLDYGVTVTGKLIKNGSPLPNIRIGTAQTSNDSLTDLGDIFATTDREGRFSLKDVGANDEYEVYGVRDSLGLRGVPGRKVVKTGEPGSTVSVGDISVTPGLKISGRVVLSDGKPLALKVPRAPVQLQVSHAGTHDYQWVDLGPDLKFELMTRDQESLTLYASIPGYHPNQAEEHGKTIVVARDSKPIKMVVVPN